MAINTIPLNSAHKDRGIGYYTQNLVDNLKKDPNLSIQTFTGISEVVDVDIIHYPWFDFFFRTLPVKRPAPTVVTIHDVIPLKFKDHYPQGIRGRINLFFQKRALRKCTAVITDSKAAKKDIVEFLKIAQEKISIIPLAADEDFKILPDADLIRTRRKYNLHERFLLYVGDANWVKNLPFLIEVFQDLIKEKGLEDLKLVLVGGAFLKKVEDIDHPELESLKKTNSLIKSYNLENRVTRVGRVEKKELVALYNLATLYIQPSIYEGFGLPVLEAMSCGVPVVSSKAGSLLEVGGEAAVYFDPDNKQQLKSILISLLENKSLQDKLSSLGLKQAKKFSWEKVAGQTLEVYSNVANF
ncbi:glycosyltransferase family 4 protein [Candidatus Daviesbacteria bacterium]|nr:glycosyltransferase family 4 protein [Candidatus Daviesbacteria bacterium]